MTDTYGSFYVSGTEIYRFRLFQDGYLPSAVVTRSYIYNDRDYYLPIVSVVTDDKNLYDDKIGAYTVGTNGITGNGISYTSNKNRAWERPVNFEYLVPDEESDGGPFLMALNQECDFEVCGGWSRNLYGPNSSFRLKGGKYYLGMNYFPYPFFKGKPYIKNKSVVVRNGGNDAYARILDAATHQIMLRSGFYVDCQDCQPVHVFINGSFMFTFNLREPNNKNHGYSNYGIDTDEMDQFEINGTKGYEQKTGDDTAFREWMSLATQLAESPDNDDLYNQICELVDIDEYCNYMAAECYIGSSDWLTNCNNVKGYRSKNDGKFNLICMDLDAAFSSTSMLSSLSGRLYDSRYDTGKSFLIDIFLNMLQYEPFKKRFIDAFCLVDGSVFETERCRQIITEMRDYKYEAIDWEGSGSSLNSSASGLINAISSGHSSRMSNMRSYFSLKKSISLQLSSNVEGGQILANGQEVPTGKFNGTFYAPMVLTAKAPAGYRFVGWQQAGDGAVINTEGLFDIKDSWYYYDQGSLDGQNWTADTYSTSTWSRNNAPFGYGNIGIAGSSDYQTTLDYGSDPDNKRPTYYFRKAFQLDSAPSSKDSYVLNGYVDDGCVVYVNGHEVGRYLMPEGDIYYETFSTTHAGATAGQCSFTLNNEWLHAGTNVIAVEVHNTHEHSSDIYWTAELLHNSLGTDYVLATEPELDLSAYGGTNLSKIVATYEPLPEEQLLTEIVTPLKVNEVSAVNSVFINDHFKKNDWIELYNTTDTELDVAGLYISDKLNNPLKYQIPSSSVINTKIPAHGHLVVWADQLDPVTQLHAPFKLGNKDGEMALIVSSDEFVERNADFFAAHPALKDFADGLTYTTHQGDQSAGRYPDGGNNLYIHTRPTIGKANSLCTTDAVTGVDEGIMDNSGNGLTLDLAQGWNWVSHPFVNALSVNRFKDGANRIVGQSIEANYSSQEHAMTGTLKTMVPHALYKMEMNEAQSYALNGVMFTAPVEIALKKGWNWIGYPEAGMQTVTAALKDMDVEEGDVLMGQDGFSVYSEADGWVGTLSSLLPGHGYLYRAVHSKTLRFKAQIAGVKLRRQARSAQTEAYGLNRNAYPNVMGLIGQLYAEEQPVDAEPFNVVAYADGICRGVGECVDGLVFLTLYGFDGEELTFKTYDAQGEELDIKESFTFTSDLTGTRSTPVALHMSSHTEDQIADNAKTVISVPVGYYSLSGTYMGTRPSRLASGFYIVRMSDGKTQKLWLR